MRDITLLACLSLTWAACGDSGSPTAPTMPPTPSPTSDTRTIQASPSFSATIQEVFVRRDCINSACHGTARQAALDLRVGAAYGSLVGVPATNEARVRVVPGDPDNSYLVIKLEGRQSIGTRMPQVGAPLDEIDLTNIRNWIAEGAQNN